jgi:hypothetical protein
MKNGSNASLAAAVLVAGSLPVIALAAAQLRRRIICRDSGIRFIPTPDIVVPFISGRPFPMSLLFHESSSSATNSA